MLICLGMKLMAYSEKKSLFEKFNTIVKWFLAILMMIIATLTFYQVVMRYVFNNAPSWSEEMVRFMFVWSSFIAAAIGIKEHIHIGVEVFVNLLPKSVARIVQIGVNLIIIIFAGYMIKYGLAVTVMTQRQPSPALGLPMSWVYSSIPVMGVLLILYCVMEIVYGFQKVRAEGEA